MLMVFRDSGVAKELRERAIAPIEFSLRQQAGKNPKLASNLKVVIYGDKAKKEFGVQELISISQWGELIEALASRRPRVILFDKFFSFTNGTVQDVENFNSRISAVKVPVIAGAAFGNLSEVSREYQPRLFANWKVNPEIPLESGTQDTLDGPTSSIRNSFTKIGSLELINTSAVQPAWREAKTGLILPHLSLSFAKKVVFKDSFVDVDETRLYLDRFGRIPVNFVRRDIELFKSFLPISPLFRNGRTATVLSKINEGDIILVLPSMYAGSTDYKNSPIGRIEGGLYHLSVINTLLTNTPIQPIFQNFWSFLTLIIFLAFITALFSLKLKIRHAIGALLASTMFLIAGGLLLFIFTSVQFDWHVLSAFILINSSTLLTIRIIKEEQQNQQIESALEGMVPEAVLKAVVSQPDILRQRPNEFSLTVMFIDIEGFSLRTKSMMPSDVFRILHAQISAISTIVHAHGGVVDRILGDGMMCFFGYTFNPTKQTTQPNSDHALQALRCAVEIQRECVRMTNATPDQQTVSGAVIPLRIGLNTGEAFLGNLGSGKRLDFTIVGHTVNMAKRLEDACETFRVLISQSTYERIQKLNSFEQLSGVAMRPRFMSVKHEDDLLVAWECDPFDNERERYEKASMRMRKSDVLRQNHNQSMQLRVRVMINGNLNGTLLSLVDGTAVLSSEKYFCRKVFLNIDFNPESEDSVSQLLKQNLKTLYMQVQYGSIGSDGLYLHTLKILHLPPERIKALQNILS